MKPSRCQVYSRRNLTFLQYLDGRVFTQAELYAESQRLYENAQYYNGEATDYVEDTRQENDQEVYNEYEYEQ
jgi:hypothetical protein